MNIQSGSQKKTYGEELESINGGIEEVLLEELLNEGVEEDLLALENDDNEDIILLSRELGCLASKS